MSQARIRGRFLWHDLMTSDPAAALLLYPRVAGWDVQAAPQDPSYTVLTYGGVPRAGVMRLPEEAASMGSPPSWLCHVGTASVDETSRLAEQLGGAMLRLPTDVAGVCRFSVLRDPQGALFAAYQPLQPVAPEAPPVRGEFSWHELASYDAVAAFDFYRALFGWEKTESADLGGLGRYQMFGLAGRSMGGMYTLPRLLDVPSHWLPYALVDDANRAASAMEAGGGRVVGEPMPSPGGDWVARLLDPQGATFAVQSPRPASADAPRSRPSRAPASGRSAAASRPARAAAAPARERSSARSPASQADRGRSGADRAKPGKKRS